MKALSLAAIVLSVFLLACGGNTPTCDECLAEQEQALDPDGCAPYCEIDDGDGDGVDDTVDKCPSDPETLNGYQDGDGCPDVKPEPVPLSTEIAGTWTGTTVLIVNGGGYDKNHSIPIVVSADRLAGSVAGFCPDGSGYVPLTATTTAPDAAWRGLYSCPSGPWGACPTDGAALRANIIVYDITAYAVPSGLRMVSHGAVTIMDGDNTRTGPCDQTGQFVAEFIGAR